MPIRMYLNTRYTTNQPVDVYGFTSYQSKDVNFPVHAALVRTAGCNFLQTIEINKLTFEPVKEGDGEILD